MCDILPVHVFIVALCRGARKRAVGGDRMLRAKIARGRPRGQLVVWLVDLVVCAPWGVARLAMCSVAT